MSVNVMERERTAIINPLKTCQPLGAMYVVTGIRRAVPLVHGSQGCSTFVRYSFSRHFREPSEIAVTSLHEDAAVFGGRRNLVEGLQNVATRLEPSLIGVITTCSSEIIGDDVIGFIKTAKDELKKKIGEKKTEKVKIIPISTPSFVETHLKGYDNAVKALVDHVAEPSEPNEKINIIPGMVNPGDIREIKHMLRLMNLEGILLTDISDPFDSPLRPSATEFKPYYPKGGTTVEEIVDSANSSGTISLTKYAGSGALSLEKKYNIPAELGPIPIGVKNTDQFLRNLKKITGQDVTDEILDERGLLIDSMADLASRYLFDKTVAIYGDPEITSGIARFVGELGMVPKLVVTGANNQEFVKDMKKVGKETGAEIDTMVGQDLRAMEVYLKDNPVDLMIGSSDARLMAKEYEIPLVRVGFPVYDRVGYHRHPIVGYNGGIHLIDLITNTVLEKYYEPEHWKLQQ
ncbi:nitrogenase component 1 [Methanobacterium petrolearium]|uniref:nitrogenase component 1 n=1 Tax=Methanobacterium petrolearium TaxID=710190 RepID=UPI001FD81A04|nr:nitrogenase component 1 [Methanobacterium petrolearium]MBP1944985.1 nitrogenase molybdenum-iron protein beta chain [Methanobacterium petrolearium]BDZ70310.1 nitrogenase molybdenum-iron protein subunit beta [Methanobacterium petrolearium]